MSVPTPAPSQYNGFQDMREHLMLQPGFNDFQEIIPGLWIGPQTSAMKLEAMRKNGIKRVLKVNDTGSLLNLARWGITRLNVTLEDHAQYELNTEKEVLPCLRFIQEGMMKTPKEGTLVICTAGMSRSATICIAYLMLHENYSYQEAFDLAKKARRFVNPNAGFVRYLQGLEKERGSMSVIRGLASNPVSKKDGCPLCTLEQKTQWFPDHTECQVTMWFKMPQRVGDKNEFTIILCDDWGWPMIVYTGPDGHVQQLTTLQLTDVVMIANNFGNQFYGPGNWFIDPAQRTVPDHFHWHIRRIDFDIHMPFWRAFGQKPIKENILISHNIESVGQLREISAALLRQHGLIKDSRNKLMTIIEKNVQSLSEQQRARRSHKSAYPIEFPDPSSSGSTFSILSEIKLYITDKCDDQGMAFIEQTIIAPPVDLIKLSYRVKFGATAKEMTRSVKHRDSYGGNQRDQMIEEILAKL